MEAIDVFIPYHPKDRRALPHVVTSLFRHLTPSPARVVCVGSGLSPRAAAAVRAAGGELLDEHSISEIPHRSAMPEIVVRGKIRTGWYYQQLLKWSFRRLSRTPAYAVIDADSVLIQQVELWRGGRYQLERTDQWHEPYFTAFERLFGWTPQAQGQTLPSFIINFQIIDVLLLNELLTEIEARGGGLPWHNCIMNAVDRTQISGFSEFETYGHWLARHHPQRFTSRPGANHETNVRWLWLRHFINAKARRRGCTTVSYHQFKAERANRFRRLIGVFR